MAKKKDKKEEKPVEEKKEEKKVEKKEPKRQEEKKAKIEKKVVKKPEEKQPQLFSLKELADIFGVSVYQMSINFSVRGIDRNKKLSLKEAEKIM